MLKLSFRNQVLAGFAISILLVFAVAILSYKSIQKLVADSEKVQHTHLVITVSSNLIQSLIDAETGMRGYCATGKKPFLEPYNVSIPLAEKNLIALKELVRDNFEQSRRSDTLAKLVNGQFNVMKTNVETYDRMGLAYMVERNMFINGKKSMDQIRSTIGRLVDSEEKLLEERKDATASAAQKTITIIIAGSAVFLVIILVLFYYIMRTFEAQKKIEADVTAANGELNQVIKENEAKNWLLTGTRLLNERMQGQQGEKELSLNVLTKLCKYTGAVTGTLYLFDERNEQLELHATYAFHNPDGVKNIIKLSEGIIGQVANDSQVKVVKGRLNEKLQLATSLIQDDDVVSFVSPFFYDNKLKGVVELAYKGEMETRAREYVESVSNYIGIAINTAQARTIMNDLFEEVQQQAEELEAQQEEMRVTNEELMNKTEMLQASEEELKVQQEELRSINAELEEKASLLEEKNQAIEEARSAINVKVQELETTGRYKSEFLANMSHELRTPLNSILVLARILKDNKYNNLSEDQIKYASVIFNAGNDLLTLINDILDLSKIESGKLEMHNEDVKVTDILGDMEMLFTEVAANKKISFSTQLANVPAFINTDKQRLEQVLKNLLSNAFKFTQEHGTITVSATAESGSQMISFHIKDTGIGIPHDKQKQIFEAFQQADGSTSRKYGGTGLGLSISRELAYLLGGKISLISEPGQGSEFTLTMPYKAKVTTAPEEIIATAETFKPPVPSGLKPAKKATETDRQPLVVIVEDDLNFADILKDYSRDHGYESILVHEGTNAMNIIKENQPDAVIMDIMLPGKDGWQILKELKQDKDTMNIPVHLMSAGDAAANRVRREGAISFIKKPIDTNALDKLFNDMAQQSGAVFKQILLVEDHQAQSQALKDMMEAQGITLDQAFDGESAFRMLNENEYQCVILDINLPDISGLDLLDKIKSVDKFLELPVIINTAMELDKTSVNRLMQYANAMVIKTSKSSDRLIDEVNLFLNKIAETADRPEASSPKPKNISKGGVESLKGKKVLIVDDDMRNIFALSSALQAYDMVVEIANDGEEAITKLEEIPDVDMVLMDIMMPKMDGYEATRYIRKQAKWAKLPVIALTAKAMKDDREKCIAAGANDYITKPVDMDRLVALMQLWLES
ncbi:histidine kinase [Mucilaginibacter hurinus]|uniref:histidine kinase n=1 Tax=Mucilaginibacter hurinus TaxID=2201324 RepID=A0A367GRW7_9SPHI|nr:response regulator [Mucilaginibacter hurinus]RCH56179.1 histidine kinase [Mucilaginibacter hurinus]